MGEAVEYAKVFARFPFALRRFLQHPLTLKQAQEIIDRRMQEREDNFLHTVESNIYSFPRSPYLALLKLAGCEFGDLHRLVKQRGLEGALRCLREADVYVSFEEFKGRRPIIRNGLTLEVQASDFDNPTLDREFNYQTGGSTGVPLNVAPNLGHLTTLATHRLVTLSAHKLIGAPTALWRGILPDLGLNLILDGALTRNLPQRWFSPLGNHDSKHWLKYGLATYYSILWMRLAGVNAPLPEHVGEGEALVIVQWMSDTLKTGQPCLVRTGVSRAVRLALAAQEHGIDLTGAAITGGGEPPTRAKVSQITRSGARFIPNYGMLEAGQPGSGCANPVDGSDVHFFKDSLALFTYPFQVEGFDVSVPAFNLTTLLPTAPKILFNVQTDDYGIVEERHCGCELETYGYSTHLREIRSYSKLTGEGVTLIGTEMLRILNEALPARFGGSPLDYQLMEEEDAQGFTRLYLIINPRVEISDEPCVVDYVLKQLGDSSSMADAARVPWQNAGTIQIKRMEPVWTERGKLLPLHISHHQTH